MALLAGVLFGALRFALGASPAEAAVAAVIWTALWAPLTLGTLLYIDHRSRRRSEPGPATWGVDSVGAIELRADLATVRAAVIAASKTIANARLASSAGERLELLIGLSWKSWGERVTVQLKATNTGTSMRVTSTPRVPTTLVDYGKGRSNVHALLRETQRLVNRPTSQEG
jgi:hypothetical protein